MLSQLILVNLIQNTHIQKKNPTVYHQYNCISIITVDKNTLYMYDKAYIFPLMKNCSCVQFTY